MKNLILTLLVGVLGFSANVFSQDGSNPGDDSKVVNPGSDSNETKDEPSTAEIAETLQFTIKSIEGKKVDLSKYAGKVVVIVNTASRCGMTPQYKDLQELHEKYGDKGVAILGFPCNQFGGQEPGSEADIKAYCTKEYGVEFDMFSKVDVKGDNASKLFKLLTAVDAKPVGAGEVRWNFEKFVLDKSGKLIARFGSRVKPSSKEFTMVLEKALNE